jgi:large subunit ribosomal protein L32e
MSKKPELSDLPGLGPKLEEKLNEAGIKTILNLSRAKADKLAEKVDGLSESRAEDFIKAAQKALPKKETKKKEAKKKKAKKAKKPEKSEPKAKTPELEDLPGVGPKMAETLKAAGVTSVKKLAETDVGKLTKVDGIGDATAESLIEAAEKALPDTSAKKKAKAKKKKAKAKKPKAKPKKKKEKVKFETPARFLKLDARLIRIAANKKKRKPQFRADQAHRWIRVSDRWRKVRGIDSYTRQKKKGRIAMVSSGYRSPKAIRYLHPSMYKEVLVHNLSDLEGLDADIHAVRIGGSVGARKRQLILAEADAKLLRVLNPGTTEEIGEEDLFTDLDLED